MTQPENIPIGLLLFLGVAATILIVVFWLLHRYVLPLIKNRKSERTASIWLLRVEALSWAAFALFAIYRLLLASPVITLILVTLICVLGWNFWKDFFAGLLFRLERKLDLGDVIHFEGTNGKRQEGIVHTINSRSISILQTNGESILIPYHRLDDLILSKSHPEGNLLRHTFTVEVKETNPAKAKMQLQKLLFECPWSVPAQSPIIEDLGNGAFQVTSFTTDSEAAEKLVGFVRERIG